MKMSVFPLVLALGASSTMVGVQTRSTPGDAPPVPFEDVGACPFEGCVYREWTANDTVVVKASRQRGAAVAFRVRKGQRVWALTGVVVTKRPGRVVFRESITLSSPDGDLRMMTGQSLYLLTYQGEGFTKAWFNGRLYTDVDGSSFFNAACEDDPRRCSGTIVERPQTEWWVQIRNRSGKTGWTDEAGKFDGKDALG